MWHSDESALMQINSLPEDFSFFKNLILIAVFFTIAPVALGVSLFSLISLQSSKNKVPEAISFFPRSNSGAKIFASLPNNTPSVGGEVVAEDARPQIIRDYLTYYSSPLLPYADLIVHTADENGLDFRLITAIAQKESNLCKLIPPNTFNCWGWGIHSEGTLGFDSFETGIRTVSKGLKDNYLDKGYVTTEEIMSKYTPMSNGSWAKGVNQFMSEME